jgi:hypothetical protein
VLEVLGKDLKIAIGPQEFLKGSFIDFCCVDGPGTLEPWVLAVGGSLYIYKQPFI